MPITKSHTVLTKSTGNQTRGINGFIATQWKGTVFVVRELYDQAFTALVNSGAQCEENRLGPKDIKSLLFKNLDNGKLVVNNIGGIDIFYNSLINGYDEGKFVAKYGDKANKNVKEALSIS